MNEVIPVVLASLVLAASLGVTRIARDIRWGYRLVAGTGVVLLAWVVYLGSGDGYALV